ncbi:MAG: DUF2513 domain-containing protein [Verrucomicrobia bacterium]|nr:DUF2513 domain-containing protein [Verrucomicrobiota bacterium]
MSLIRLLLLKYEGEEPKPDLSDYTNEQQLEHSVLLIEAGLVHGLVEDGNNGLPATAIVLRLAWPGHDFLAQARNETIWKKATEKLKKAAVEVPLSLLGELLKSMLKEELGLK